MLNLGVFGSLEGTLLLFGFLPFILIVITLIDILKNEFHPEQNKLIWVLVTILVPVLGAVLYFAIGRAQRVDQS